MSLIDEAQGVRQRIAERLRELEPLVAEYNQLRKLAADMGIDAGNRSAPPASSAPSRQRSTRAGSARGRGSRARPQPEAAPGAASELAQRVLAAVRADPGRTVADYSASLGVAPTALYRPVRELTTEGALLKRARQLFPAED